MIQPSVSFSLSQLWLTLLVSVQLSLSLRRLPWCLTFLGLIKCFSIVLIFYVFPGLAFICWTSPWGICEIKFFKKNMKLYTSMIKYVYIRSHPKPPHLSQHFSCFMIKFMCNHKANMASCRGSPQHFLPLNKLPGKCWQTSLSMCTH